jgi:hypothetical protein
MIAVFTEEKWSRRPDEKLEECAAIVKQLMAAQP